MNELERLLKAKIPCKETGIEVKHTICDICATAPACGIDAYIKDGRVIKIEGTKEHPVNHGLLCTKGLSNRQYIYRKDRIRTPLKRIGEKGKGKFEEITWDEAYKIIAERLNRAKADYGADSVVFFAGFDKWFRPFLQRLAYAFGSINYGNEGSTCFMATAMAWKIATGESKMKADFKNAGLFLGWSYSAYYSDYLLPMQVEEARKNGLKVIIVDPRRTPATAKQCDLHLRIKPGTDGALAHGMAKIMIENGWIDHDFIDKYVYGYEEYKEYVKQFDINKVSKITSISPADIMAAVKMMAENASVAINEGAAPLVHHTNGMQNYRAVMALSAIMGTYGKAGGQLPVPFTYGHYNTGFETMEHQFSNELRPRQHRKMVGSERYPLWAELVGEMQAVDLSRQILEEEPYPIRALFALGMNYRIVNDSGKMREALEKIDFFVDTDLFLTDTAKYADIVLPACSSFERSEFRGYYPGYIMMTRPVIEQLYQSKPDTEILCDLAKYLNLDDELLKSGYDHCIRYMLKNLDFNLEEIKASPFMLKVPGIKPETPNTLNFKTPTGKFELKSTIIEKYAERSLDALPTYREPVNNADPDIYPFILCSGGRIPNAIHSRLHDVGWTRSLRPDPMADMNDEDAIRLGISRNDDIEIFTEKGSITVKANPTSKIMPGIVNMYHGYREADVNMLIDAGHTDPYSGYPAYNRVCCGIRKKVE
ncbi:MAG: molybdopterin-dependent oxidoreductase [Dehalobacterium sp.]